MRGVLKPKAERIEHDAYFTPQALANEICRRLCEVVSPDLIIDPCCGNGAFKIAAHNYWRQWTIDATDLPERDFLTYPYSYLGPRTLIVSNPPYNLAEPFVHRALQISTDGGTVAFLLRLSFLGGQKRYDTLWRQSGLRLLYPIVPRPSFTPDGKTDASEYGLFVWTRGYQGMPLLMPHLRWRERGDWKRGEK